jgi:hypothetical protein
MGPRSLIKLPENAHPNLWVGVLTCVDDRR